MTGDSSRVMSTGLRSKIMSADDAAALVPHGSNVGMSGFTGSGYPKAVPLALARRIEDAHRRGQPFRIGVWTGASTAPELDGALAKVDGIELRLPYQSDPRGTDQHRNNGIYRYSSQPCRAVCLVRFSGTFGYRVGRGSGHPAGRQSGALDFHR